MKTATDIETKSVAGGFTEHDNSKTAKEAAYWQGRTDEVIVQALRCICGGDMAAARRLMGQQ